MITLTPDSLNAFFSEAFHGPSEMQPIITDLSDGSATVRIASHPSALRPGGSFSGPTQMAMADTAAYAAIFTKTGIVPMAVTTNLNINFLRPCIGEAVIATANIIKMGRTQVIIEVEIKAEGSVKLASHAIVTYALPKADNEKI